MPQLQTTYSERHGPGLLGQIVDATPAVLDSWLTQEQHDPAATSEAGSGPIEFGRMVQAANPGTDDARYKHFTYGVEAASNAANAALTSYIGITVQDQTRLGGRTPRAVYRNGELATILSQGDIWVRVPSTQRDGSTAHGGVHAGDTVTVRVNTGVLTNETAVASGGSGSFGDSTYTEQIAEVPNARWMTAADRGELAILRLGARLAGHQG